MKRVKVDIHFAVQAEKAHDLVEEIVELAQTKYGVNWVHSCSQKIENAECKCEVKLDVQP